MNKPSGGEKMINPDEIEEIFQEYMSDLNAYAPDGIYEVTLSLLQELDLLSVSDVEVEDGDLSYSFYVIESPEKLTLYNQKFVVWIVPQMVDDTPITFTLIALNSEEEEPRLEMVFSTSGIYNHSNLVLRILEKFLAQIEENEEEICKLKD